MVKISIVTVDFNGLKSTKKMLDSLLAQKGLNVDFLLEVYVVDNSDKENVLKDFFSQNGYDFVNLIFPGKNLGYFGGINYAMRLTDCIKSDYLVVCNNDLIFEKDFLIKIIKKDYEDNVYCIVPNVINNDGFNQNPHVVNRIGLLRKLKYDIYFSNYSIAKFLTNVKNMAIKILGIGGRRNIIYENGFAIHMGIGAIYVFNKKFLSKNTALYYPYFLYGEEAFLSNQVIKSGGVIWFDPHLNVLHDESSTTSKVPRKIIYDYARDAYSEYRKYL